MRVSQWEINHSIDLLEREGYLVRRPSEIALPVTLEVVPHQSSPYEVSVRADAVFNGVPCYLAQSFPVERLLDPDSDEFRTHAVPQIMSSALARFMADSLREGIAEQVEKKIKPLVPEKRMSLFEIESYIAWALRDCRAEKDGTEAE
jgi:hypothetical protein